LPFLVVSFNSNGKVTISRSQQVPSSLNRAGLQFSGVEGGWKITDYPQHPECVGCEFEIKRQDNNENAYRLHTRVINNLNTSLEYNPSTKQWKSSHGASTLMAGPPELMQKETVVNSLISGIQKLEVQGDQQLLLKTNNGEQVRLERFTKGAPSPVTQNIFN
jgi:hypothetical protein